MHTWMIVLVLAGLFQGRRYTRRRGTRRLKTPPMDSMQIIVPSRSDEMPPAQTPEWTGRQDPLWGTALLVVATTREASPTLLQQRMGVDYARAVALLNAMEAEGHIGPARAGAARLVFIRAEDLAK